MNNDANLRRSGMSKGKWIGLGIAVTVVILLLYYTFQPFQAGDLAEDVIQAHLTAIRQGDLQQAYSYCSWKFQQRNSSESFQDFVKRNPQLNSAQEFDLERSRTEGGVVALHGNVLLEDGGKLPMYYQVVSENGVWKIHSMNAGSTTL